MRFVSTRDAGHSATLSQALARGIAPDGGLYVPERFPALRVEDFDGATTLPEVAGRLLAPFFAGDALERDLPDLCAHAFAFDAPLVPLPGANASVLELFHGPTAAFKDYGARFLAAALSRLNAGAQRPLTILVATSGDTGSAVGAACHGLPNVRVAILYPAGRVSPRQAHQLGCFGGNVRAFRVAGSFDDCQRMVKSSFADASLRADVPLTSANSISLGRLLPQMAYYAHAARAHPGPLPFIVPTGNLGNALAAILARAMGVPIGDIVLAGNANRVLPAFFAGAAYEPRASVATIANAMDVGDPSNFERLCWLYPDEAALRIAFRAHSVGDDEIRAAIRAGEARHGRTLDPHTACAAVVLERLRAGGDRRHYALVATAHPAKFETVVEPLVGHAIPVPAALAAMLARPAAAEPLAADAGPLVRALRDW
jgi:threonine synthase